MKTCCLLSHKSYNVLTVYSLLGNNDTIKAFMCNVALTFDFSSRDFFEAMLLFH